jgi:NNP family nitrate/nitrite transporter-like MFS transporter
MQGTALGWNAGVGNLGVGVVQAVVPLVIYAGAFTILGGESQVHVDGEVVSEIWLQNAGFAWVPFILGATFASALSQNNIREAHATFAKQGTIFRCKHAWLLAWLYTGTFGSFIGFAAAFSILLYTLFPQAEIIRWAFVGPLLGAMIRPLGGWLSDRIGGAKVTFWNFVVMLAAAIGLLLTTPTEASRDDPAGFFVAFMLLFISAGVGNGSVFHMVPTVFRKLHEVSIVNQLQNGGDTSASKGEIEASVALGFASSIAALGLFFIPALVGVSIKSTGSPRLALFLFIAFYASCILVTWRWYRRPGADVRYD